MWILFVFCVGGAFNAQFPNQDECNLIRNAIQKDGVHAVCMPEDKAKLSIQEMYNVIVRDAG